MTAVSLSDVRRARPSGALEAGHGVEFYGYDAQIVRTVADFLTPGLDRDEAAIVIATEPHRNALDGELAARGVNVDGARANGRLMILDAATTLSKFLSDKGPEPERFEAVLGSAIARAQSTGATHVRAYGEMVALLWLAGRPQAALALERLWNDLARKLSFTLLCGYPISAFSPTQAAEIAEIGRTHTQVGQLQRALGTVRP